MLEPMYDMQDAAIADMAEQIAALKATVETLGDRVRAAIGEHRDAALVEIERLEAEVARCNQLHIRDAEVLYLYQEELRACRQAEAREAKLRAELEEARKLRSVCVVRIAANAL